jgi:hypothetical protein
MGELIIENLEYGMILKELNKLFKKVLIVFHKKFFIFKHI